MTSPPEPKTIQKLVDVFPSFALLAGMQLDLFTPLKAGPMRPEQIANTIGVDVAKLKPLLYALVAAELLTVEGDRFANTDEANHFLVRGSPAYMGGIHPLYADLWDAALQTAESIRTGQPQAKHDYTQMSREALETFYQGLHPGALVTGRTLVKDYGLSSCHRLLDVGGGSGGVAIAVVKACPHIRATVADVSNVTPITQRFVTEAGVSDRVKVITANIVEAPLHGAFDAVVLKSFIQVLSPGDAQRALGNVNATMAPGGVIYILGIGILDNSRTSPRAAAISNTIFINIYDEGQAYTEDEYHDWLTAAGFVDFKRDTLPDGLGIITAQKPM
jgi:SAM-dependent methyltransferase